MQKTIFLFFLSYLSLSGFGFTADLERSAPSSLYDRLEYIKVLLAAGQNDIALDSLYRLQSEVELSGKGADQIGTWVQFYIGDALEKDHKDEEAIKILLRVKEESYRKSLPDIYAESCIVLALLYEKLNMPEECHRNLKTAGQQIVEHQLDSIFPEFAIRSASYHRIYADQDSAIYFAQKALEAAHEIGLTEQAAVSHALLGLLSKGQCDKALFHFQRSRTYYANTGDYTGYAYSLLNTVKTNLSCNRLKAALHYSDSSMATIKLAQNSGNDFYTWGNFYRARAEVFFKLGRYDSAWHNINIAGTLDLKQEQRSNAEEVKEIDAKYNDDKKVLKLAEQEKVIQYEQQRRAYLTVLILLILSFFAILIYFYLKLRIANRKTVLQAEEISNNNVALVQSLEEQVILQSEIHHRVKNNLQVIISLIEIQKDEIQDPEVSERFEAISNRIYSMSAIHEILHHQKEASQINFLEYTEEICGHLEKLTSVEEKPKFNMEIDPVSFNLETSIPLGIMLNELVTNSLKYATVPGQQLIINIRLEPQEVGYKFEFKDNGPGLKTAGLPENGSGLGIYLLGSMARQLNGKLEYCNETGATFNIYFEEKNKLSLIEIDATDVGNVQKYKEKD